jgi:dUTP pyrophosphatase
MNFKLFVVSFVRPHGELPMISETSDNPFIYEHVGIRLEFKRISEKGKIPFRKRPTDAGYDLYSIETVDLRPNSATLIRTGIAIACPPGYYYTIEGRSSLWTKGVFPNRGIIDSTFTDEVIVSMVNVSDKIFTVQDGDRIAQIILSKQYDANFVLVEKFSDAYNQRGTAGFGSSGR